MAFQAERSKRTAVGAGVNRGSTFENWTAVSDAVSFAPSVWKTERLWFGEPSD